MALIDADDAGAASGRVVQNRFGDLEADAELLQICRNRPAEVMERPMRQSYSILAAILLQNFDHRSIDRLLGF